MVGEELRGKGKRKKGTVSGSKESATTGKLWARLLVGRLPTLPHTRCCILGARQTRRDSQTRAYTKNEMLGASSAKVPLSSGSRLLAQLPRLFSPRPSRLK